HAAAILQWSLRKDDTQKEEEKEKEKKQIVSSFWDEVGKKFGSKDHLNFSCLLNTITDSSQKTYYVYHNTVLLVPLFRELLRRNFCYYVTVLRRGSVFLASLFFPAFMCFSQKSLRCRDIVIYSVAQTSINPIKRNILK
ncbi:hypothetical protein CEXT_594761, partial [Caerostris extrusa]